MAASMENVSRLQYSEIYAILNSIERVLLPNSVGDRLKKKRSIKRCKDSKRGDFYISVSELETLKQDRPVKESKEFSSANHTEGNQSSCSARCAVGLPEPKLGNSHNETAKNDATVSSKSLNAEATCGR